MRFSRSYRQRLLPLLAVIVVVQCSHALALPVLNHDESHTQYKRTPPPSASSSSSSSSSQPAATSTNSQICLFSQQSCHFYSHCIESHFHCGPTGFTQAYAETRCERIDQLRNRNDDACDHCIGSTALFNWAVHQDSCLKQKLLSVVETDYKTERSDPPTCLQLEQHGLRFLQECSVENSDNFCSALAGDQAGFERDIEKIARHFRVSSYYTTRVERMLKNLISSCGEEDRITAMAESVLAEGFHSQRFVFCAVIFSSFKNIIDNSTAVQLISQNLNKPVEQFSFSGLDEARKCVTNYRYPEEISPSPEDDLMLITWNPEPNDPLIETIGTRKYEEDSDIEGSYIDIVFYQYSPLRSSEEFPECGDGQRQAGEMCDMGVWNYDPEDDEDVASCSFSCVPSLPWVECSVGQLARSECWEVSCGDGVRSVGEECDDGNFISGDGCSSCRQDPDFICTTAYNSTSVCTHESATEQTTYPPAITSALPTLHTAASSSSQLTQGQSSSSTSPPSSLTPSTPSHLTEAPPSVGQLSADSSQSATTHLHWRNVAIQCLVSVLLSWTAVHLLMAR